MESNALVSGHSQTRPISGAGLYYPLSLNGCLLMNGHDSRSSKALTESGTSSFTWARIQRLYDADSAVHWQRCEAEGLQCPQEVFSSQLFYEEAHDEGFAVIVRAVDWGRVNWELEEMSGVALRYLRVDRGYQFRNLKST